MPLSGLIATTEYAPEARYRDRRPTPDRRATQEPAPALAPSADAADLFDAAFYARRFKTDLTQLTPYDGPEPPPSPDAAGDSALMDFFGHLSVLLVAVRAGDIARAQAAADTLELDALVERAGGRRSVGSGAMLEDLVGRLRAAPAHSAPAARSAAAELAEAIENVVAPTAVVPRDPYAEEDEDGAAAYDTLMHYFDDPAGSI